MRMRLNLTSASQCPHLRNDAGMLRKKLYSLISLDDVSQNGVTGIFFFKAFRFFTAFVPIDCLRVDPPGEGVDFCSFHFVGLLVP